MNACGCEPGDRGIVIDLEPPDDSPIVSFERVGAVVLAARRRPPRRRGLNY